MQLVARSPAVVAAVLLVVALAILPADANAQLFSYGGDRPRSVQSLSFVYKIIDFNFDGEAPGDATFEFAGPAYGAFYTRQNFTASITYGPTSEEDTRDLRLLDAAIMTWGEIIVGGTEGRSRIFVPIGIASIYRRVAPRGSEDSLVDAFNVTVLGLGAGIGGSIDLAESVRLEGRAMPYIGLALRTFGDSAGSSYLADADLRLHLMDLVGRVGLSAGYGFRAQVWNVGASDLLLDEHDDLFDYSGAQHAFTVGLNW